MRHCRRSAQQLIARTSSTRFSSIPQVQFTCRQIQARGLFSLLRRLVGNGNGDKMDDQRKVQAADALRTAMAALAGNLCNWLLSLIICLKRVDEKHYKNHFAGSKSLPDMREVRKLSSTPMEQLSVEESESGQEKNVEEEWSVKCL